MFCHHFAGAARGSSVVTAGGAWWVVPAFRVLCITPLLVKVETRI